MRLSGDLSPQAELARLAREDGRGSARHGDRAGRPPRRWDASRLSARTGLDCRRPRVRGPGRSGARRSGEELVWVERSEVRGSGGRQVFRRRGRAGPAAVHPRCGRLCGGALQARPGDRMEAVRLRPAGRVRDRGALPRGRAGGRRLAGRGVRAAREFYCATYIAVLTHDPKLDYAALSIGLRSEAAYVGAMGSRRAQARRRERLLEAGLNDAELEGLAAPIGLDLGATSPEETALSILAEVVAVRNGHEGGRLGRARRADPRGRRRWRRRGPRRGRGPRASARVKLGAQLDGTPVLDHAVAGAARGPRDRARSSSCSAANAEVVSTAAADLGAVEAL